jgi:hypothetical protein
MFECKARAVFDVNDFDNTTFVRPGETDEQAAQRIGATEFEAGYIAFDGETDQPCVFCHEKFVLCGECLDKQAPPVFDYCEGCERKGFVLNAMGYCPECIAAAKRDGVAWLMGEDQ